MDDKILFVDDDSNLLEGYARKLRKRFPISTALGGREGLAIAEGEGPFAVIISDMQMPEMNGIEFLTAVKKHHGDAVRVMITGNADLQTAAQAVNEGNIFRFLTKPCAYETLVATLEAAVEQYHLVIAERELLENTLRASVNVLTEILSLVNPIAFSQSSRIRNYVKHIAGEMNLPKLWQYDMAAMLSQIGGVTLPPLILQKVHRSRELSFVENKMYTSHPKVGAKLLASIPRMEQVASMIEGQQEDFPGQAALDGLDVEEIPVALGSQLLRIALDFDRLVIRGLAPDAALSALRKRENKYNPRLLDYLETFEGEQVEAEEKEVTLEELEIGMITDEHIRSKKGAMLVPRGHEVTYTVMERLRNFSHGGGIREPFRVRVVLEDEFAYASK